MNVLKQKYEEAKAFVALYESATGSASPTKTETKAAPVKSEKVPEKEVEKTGVDREQMVPLSDVVAMNTKERNDYCRNVLGLPWNVLRKKEDAQAAIKEVYKNFPELTAAGKAAPKSAPVKAEVDYKAMPVMQLKKYCKDQGLEVPASLQPKAFYIELLEGGSPEPKAETPKAEKKAPAKKAPKKAATPYDGMTPKEMFQELRTNRGFAKGTVKPSQPEEYYIQLLMDDDAKKAAEAEDEGWDEVAADDDDNWDI